MYDDNDDEVDMDMKRMDAELKVLLLPIFMYSIILICSIYSYCTLRMYSTLLYIHVL